MMGTRSVEAKLALTEKDMYGNPPFGEWYAANKDVKLGSFAETAASGEIILNVTQGANSINALKWAGLMVNPNMIGGGDHTAFICGNDVTAKAKVKLLMNEFGWKSENILDLGDIS